MEPPNWKSNWKEAMRKPAAAAQALAIVHEGGWAWEEAVSILSDMNEINEEQYQNLILPGAHAAAFARHAEKLGIDPDEYPDIPRGE